MEAIRTRENQATNDAARAQSRDTKSEPDGTFDRILKLVPAEVIAGYTALLAIADTVSTSALRGALPVALVACTALIVLTLLRKDRAPRLQFVFALLAFWSWAFAIRDPLAPFGIPTPAWIPAFACILVPAFGAVLIDYVYNKPAAG